MGSANMDFLQKQSSRTALPVVLSDQSARAWSGQSVESGVIRFPILQHGQCSGRNLKMLLQLLLIGRE